MAMQRQLWSVNGLSVELGVDRRTVAKALDGVTPDGDRSGSPVWLLKTALEAIEACRKPGRREVSSPARARRNRVLELLVDRSVQRREIESGGGPAQVSIDDVAEWFDVDKEDVLVWLRAGLPYVVKGDFESGTGFVLSAPWTLDWVMMTSALAYVDGDNSSRSDLCLPP